MALPHSTVGWSVVLDYGIDILIKGVFGEGGYSNTEGTCEKKIISVPRLNISFPIHNISFSRHNYLVTTT